jgi:hypothetical protein
MPRSIKALLKEPVNLPQGLTKLCWSWFFITDFVGMLLEIFAFLFQTEQSLTNLQRSIHPITLQKLRGILYLQENSEQVLQPDLQPDLQPKVQPKVQPAAEKVEDLKGGALEEEETVSPSLTAKEL